MQWQVTQTECGVSQLIITQDQGDNTPTIITFPYDITEIEFSGTIAFPTPILLSLGDGIEVIDAEGGKISMQLTSEQTQDILAGQYAFDLWTINNDTSPPINSDPLTGFFTINTALTRIS